MVKFGKFIAKYKYIVLLICLALLVPSAIGYVNTRVNYDVLSYLPHTLDTVSGQDILVDQFGMGAFSMVVVEGMEQKEIDALQGKMEDIGGVNNVLWYGDLVDISIPTQLLPNDLQEQLFHGDAALMIALFDNTTSADQTMKAIEELRATVGKQCFVSGMSGVVTDIKNLSMKEMPVYVIIAAALSFLVLALFMESFVVPILFLFSIGVGIVYNLGSNRMIGEISYITQALTAVLQLGVTMDYSIFLLSSYQENKVRFDNDKQRAMAHAISNTFKSVAGSSVTTLAGFAALIFMTFALGKNIGIVMMKGVVIGVICCITLLPALILVFDGAIEKTKHRDFIPSMRKASNLITKHYVIWIVIFLIMLLPALYGNNNVKLYYNLDSSLPKTLDSSVANKKLEENFEMNSVYMVLLKGDFSAKEKTQMLDGIESVDGVKWALGLNSIVGPTISDDFVPDELKEKLKSGEYEIQFVCSDYKTATDEINNQIAQVDDIIKSYGDENIVIGEAPLTKDLADVTNVDLITVNVISVAAIFIIILIVYKSITLPFLLVAVIEFAIFVNMAIPFYTGEALPFVASIVIGTIQLGATVDYAILMTGRYQKERFKGAAKKEAIRVAHETSMKPIIISGLSFFAATFGVGLYSKIDMISAITALLSRGAIISTIVVLTVLPAFFIVFDRVICVTSIGFINKEKK